MQLKRLWDTDGKKIVYTEGPTGHKCQVWTDENGNLYIYDMAQWLTYNGVSTAGEEYVRSNWVALTDQMVGFYDTNEPTDLYNRDHGDEAYYQFVDWDGTVLKSGTVDEGETPTAPADPTRAATAQYTYTFAGWNPTVGPISKRTTFTATYTATVNKYDITFVDEDGTTELDSQELDYGATPVYAGETPTKEATAQYTYTFSGWTPDIAPVTGDATYTAVYSATINQYTATIESEDTSKGTVDDDEVTADYGTAISASGNVLTIGNTTITATAEEGYAFSSWGTLPETLTEDVTITATFTATSVLVESISNVPETLTGTASTESGTDFRYSPTNATNVTSQITAVSSDDGVAEITGTASDNGNFFVYFNCVSAGEATFTYYINGTQVAGVSTTVTVNAPL